MRISGIASGFDTDAMVKSMMAVERMKVDRFEKSKQLALWKQESFNNMNKAFANFILNTQKDMGLKKTSSTGSIANTSYKNVDYVKKATSSNEAAATVSSTSNAVAGSFTVNVESIAKSATLTSAEITDFAGLKETSEYKLIDGKHFRQVEFKINGELITISKEVESDEQLVDFEITDIVKGINNHKGEVAVSAFYDSGTKRMFLQAEAKDTLNDSFDLVIEGVGTAGNELASKLNTGSIKQNGSIAKVTINGLDIKQTNNNIKFNGLNIELKSVGETTINVSTNTEGIMEKIDKLVKDYNDLIDLASLSVSEKAYPGYQPLTAEERKSMSESDIKLWDEKAKSGLLNRDETIQRTLQNIRNDLYKTVEGLDEDFNHITKIGITTEKYSRGSAGGKLVIDTDKLRDAIEANPDAVMDLLFKEGPKKPYSESKPNEKDYEGDPEGYKTALKTYEEGLRAHEKTENANRKANNGIFTNIYDNLITGMQAIVDKSGPGQDSDLLRGVKSNILIDFVTKKGSISDIDKSVKEMNRQMDNLNILLAKKEDSYYAKFTAMEKAMHKMNSQSGWLAQQFG